jgi:hypothetical protein
LERNGIPDDAANRLLGAFARRHDRNGSHLPRRCTHGNTFASRAIVGQPLPRVLAICVRHARAKRTVAPSRQSSGGSTMAPNGARSPPNSPVGIMPTCVSGAGRYPGCGTGSWPCRG